MLLCDPHKVMNIDLFFFANHVENHSSKNHTMHHFSEFYKLRVQINNRIFYQ